MNKLCNLSIVSLAFFLGGTVLRAQETKPAKSPAAAQIETQPATQPAAKAPTKKWKTKSDSKPKKKSPETRSSSESQTSPSPETASSLGETQPSTRRTPTPTGEYKKIPYAEGENCEAEPAGMQASGYTLRLSFIEGGAESVCGVGVTIHNVKGKELFSIRVKSPWLYVDLPAGGYVVRAKKQDGESTTLSTQTAPGKLQKTRVFFK